MLRIGRTPRQKPDGLKARTGIFGRLKKDRSGATALEFAILAMPFFVILFASVETFVAFTGEQVINAATDNIARQIRTGQITFNQGKSTDKTRTEFRAAVCQEIAVMISCSASEAETPSKLFIDVRTVSSYDNLPPTLPRTGGAGSDINTAGFDFAPGGPGTINMIRIYYRWTVITDLVRPYVTNLRPAGSSMPNDYLMVATSTFQTENY